MVEEKSAVLKLPNAALKWVDGRQVVFVREAGGAVRQTAPTLGLIGLAASEVLAGLEEGEEVATQVDLPGPAARRTEP